MRSALTGRRLPSPGTSSVVRNNRQVAVGTIDGILRQAGLSEPAFEGL